MAVGGNNLSACCGPLIGSGMVNRRTGILLAITGYILGLALEGPKLFRVREIFLPIDTATGTFSILLASLIVFLGGELSQIPLSLSKALTGAILGVSMALGAFNSAGYQTLTIKDRPPSGLIPLSLRPGQQYPRTHSRSRLQPDSLRNSGSRDGCCPRHIRPRTGRSAKTDRRHLQPPLPQRVLLSANRIRDSRTGEPARSAFVYNGDRILRNHWIWARPKDANNEC